MARMLTWRIYTPLGEQWVAAEALWLRSIGRQSITHKISLPQTKHANAVYAYLGDAGSWEEAEDRREKQPQPVTQMHPGKES